MGIASSSSAPEPAAASAPPPPPTTPPSEAAAPPHPSTTGAADSSDKNDDAGAENWAAEAVVVDVAEEAGKEGEGDEEEGECGFCLFMKGGGCKEEFVAWEKCVEDAEAAGKNDDVVDLCHDTTAALRKCMDAHADYYEPILRAERAMAEDLEAAQAREASGSEPAPSSSPEAPEPASATPPGEEVQKKQADDVVLDSDDKKKGGPAA
jgi:hypothetical protein